MNREINVFLLIFIIIFALFSITSICFAAKEERLWGRPGLAGNALPSRELMSNGNKIDTLKVATNGLMTVALRESEYRYTNKLLVFFPGQDQVSNIINAFPFIANTYNYDIAVVQTSNMDDLKHAEDAIPILNNYLRNQRVSIIICGYSAGGRGAINLTTAILRNEEFKYINKNRIELIIIDGMPIELAEDYHIEEGIRVMKEIIDSAVVKRLTIIASGDTFSISKRTTKFLAAFDGKNYNSSKFMQIDRDMLEKYKNYKKTKKDYTTHPTVVNFLYDNPKRVFVNPVYVHR